MIRLVFLNDFSGFSAGDGLVGGLEDRIAFLHFSLLAFLLSFP